MTSSDIHVAVNGWTEFLRTRAIDWLVRFPGEVRPRWQRESLSPLCWLAGGCMAPYAGVWHLGTHQSHPSDPSHCGLLRRSQ